MPPGPDINRHQQKIAGHHLSKDAAQRFQAGDIDHAANGSHEVKPRPNVTRKTLQYLAWLHRPGSPALAGP
jgi:hypothetical protein